MTDDYDLNRRSHNRHRCLVSARLYVPGQPAVECSIRDLTPEGARITLPADALRMLPDKLLLLLPGLAELWAVRVCWRSRHTIGVEFVPGEADTHMPSTQYSDIFALRVQVADLARDYPAADATRNAIPRKLAKAGR
jgi:hypothetical protein